ncbi:clavesin-1-like [Hyposmocoma kahamanoa]|uniref:clavesin-1-like n=1 Tax=Hyposmocoma kahamanoa TaxID=1477025 RepID=UPI000E6D9EE6|nr:clavesin-1-like [Hyposmocoma kahamanoa]
MSSAVSPFPLEEEYQKDTGITPEDIRKLREWLKTQPHLPADYITDMDLILAYRSCDRSYEVSKQLLDLNFTLKTLFTDFFKDRKVDHRIDAALKSILVTPLPSRTNDGYGVLYATFMNSDWKSFLLPDIIKTVIMVIDIWQYEEGSWPGFIILFDLKNMSLGHLTKLDLNSVRHYLYYLQEALLANLRGVHYLNAPAYMDKLMSIVRPFMSNSLLNVLYVHQPESATLQPYFPSEELPKESGGNFKSVHVLKDEILSKLYASSAFFEEENKKRVTESLRPDKPKTISDFFGSVEGTFKKLEFD